MQEELLSNLKMHEDLNAKEILNIMKRIGRIDDDSVSSSVFIELLSHKIPKVRLEAVKNLGKFKDDVVIDALVRHYYREENSNVKRECISSLGRQRSEKLISFFITTLEYKDPKIVLQAIRALLVFKNHEEVREALIKVMDHPNEMIQEVLNIELNPAPKRSRHNHVSVDERLKNVVVNGDVLNILSGIEEESFHLTFTSPPYYNARDYSFYSSYKEYLDFLRKVFIEVHRLTKNGRFVIVNTSPVIVSRFSRKHSSKRYPIPFDLHNIMVDIGWEFIDDIIWKKPEYSVKNRVGGFMQHRKPLGYKPNSTTEYLMVYRKKSRDLLDWNIKQYDSETVEKSKVTGDFDTTNVWEVDPKFDKGHSAIFPEELCRKVIEYYSYVGDLVFDPFAGSGTLGKVAYKYKRNFFLTEINKEYFELIEDRFSDITETKFVIAEGLNNE